MILHSDGQQWEPFNVYNTFIKEKEKKVGVPGEIKRREVELDPQVTPEEIMSREVELGYESWTSFTSGCSSTAVQRTLSLWLCPARQLKQQLRSARSLRSFSGGLFAVEPSLSHPLHPPPPAPSHPLSPSLISNLASVDVMQNGPYKQACKKSRHTKIFNEASWEPQNIPGY